VAVTEASDLIRAAADVLDTMRSSSSRSAVSARAAAAAAASAGAALLQIEHARRLAADSELHPFDADANPLTSSASGLRLRAAHDLRLSLRHATGAGAARNRQLAEQLRRLSAAAHRALVHLEPTAGADVISEIAMLASTGDEPVFVDAGRRRPWWPSAQTIDLR
jgi:hypothetical protein